MILKKHSALTDVFLTHTHTLIVPTPDSSARNKIARVVTALCINKHRTGHLSMSTVLLLGSRRLLSVIPNLQCVSLATNQGTKP